MNIKCCEYCGAEKPDSTSIGELVVHFTQPVAEFKGQRLALTKCEQRMLYYLVLRRRASYDALAILPNGDYATNQTVNVRMCRLRKKFEDAGLPFNIETIRAYGYEITEKAA